MNNIEGRWSLHVTESGWAGRVLCESGVMPVAFQRTFATRNEAERFIVNALGDVLFDGREDDVVA